MRDSIVNNNNYCKNPKIPYIPFIAITVYKFWSGNKINNFSINLSVVISPWKCWHFKHVLFLFYTSFRFSADLENTHVQPIACAEELANRTYQSVPQKSYNNFQRTASSEWSYTPFINSLKQTPACRDNAKQTVYMHGFFSVRMRLYFFLTGGIILATSMQLNSLHIYVARSSFGISDTLAPTVMVTHTWSEQLSTSTKQIAFQICQSTIFVHTYGGRRNVVKLYCDPLCCDDAKCKRFSVFVFNHSLRCILKCIIFGHHKTLISGIDSDRRIQQLHRYILKAAFSSCSR